jgi:uncharacterized protein YrrD
MLKGKSVIGKDVMSRADGEKVAELKDIIISKDHGHVLAILTHGGGVFGKPSVVPFAKIVSFGKDAVMVTDKASEQAAEAEPTIKESLDSKDHLVGKRVITERGDVQAKVNDIFFDETSGNIVGLELVGGVVDNSPDGTAYLPTGDIISIGKDAVVIKADAVGGLLQQASGTAQNPGQAAG